MFVDVVKIFIKSGTAEMGAVSFHREKYMPNGGRTAETADADETWFSGGKG